MLFKENTFYIIKHKVWLTSRDEDFLFRKDDVMYIVDVSIPSSVVRMGEYDVQTFVRVVYDLETIDLVIHKREIEGHERRFGSSLFEEVVET